MESYLVRLSSGAKKQLDKKLDNNPDERKKSGVYKDGNNYYLRAELGYDIDFTDIIS